MFSVSDRVHHAFCADVSSSSSINELMQNIQAAFKGVPSIAVNSAGITRDAMMLKMTEENFDKVLSVNLKVCDIKLLQGQNLIPVIKASPIGQSYVI